MPEYYRVTHDRDVLATCQNATLIAGSKQPLELVKIVLAVLQKRHLNAPSDAETFDIGKEPLPPQPNVPSGVVRIPMQHAVSRGGVHSVSEFRLKPEIAKAIAPLVHRLNNRIAITHEEKTDLQYQMSGSHAVIMLTLIEGMLDSTLQSPTFEAGGQTFNKVDFGFVRLPGGALKFASTHNPVKLVEQMNLSQLWQERVGMKENTYKCPMAKVELANAYLSRSKKATYTDCRGISVPNTNIGFEWNDKGTPEFFILRDPALIAQLQALEPILVGELTASVRRSRGFSLEPQAASRSPISEKVTPNVPAGFVELQVRNNPYAAQIPSTFVSAITTAIRKEWPVQADKPPPKTIDIRLGRSGRHVIVSLSTKLLHVPSNESIGLRRDLRPVLFHPKAIDQLAKACADLSGNALPSKSDESGMSR